jgi:hypothetical protein
MSLVALMHVFAKQAWVRVRSQPHQQQNVADDGVKVIFQRATALESSVG